MGLSASQCKLITLEAKISDLQFQAQQINQQKLILAQQTERASRKYQEATSNRRMKIGLYQDVNDKATRVEKNLTYTALISGTIARGNLNNESGIQASEENKDYSGCVCSTCYRLVDSNGAIVVSDVSEIPTIIKSNTTTTKNLAENKYITHNGNDDSKTNNIYGFLKSLGNNANKANFRYGEDAKHPDAQTENDGTVTHGNGIIEVTYGSQTKYFSAIDGKEIEELDKFTKDIYDSGDKCNANVKYDGNDVILNISKTISEEGSSILAKEEDIEKTIDSFGVYHVGGKCYIVDERLKGGNTDGLGNITASNYLQDVLRNGKYLLQKGDVDDDDKEFRWHNVSWDGTANINDEYYTDDDEAAKAEYDREQAMIQNKEKQLDMDLDNIETQVQALQNEKDAEEKIISEHAEEFKIFQQG